MAIRFKTREGIPYLLVKCHSIYYLSSNNQCSNYSNSSTTHCLQTMFMPLFYNRLWAYSCVATVRSATFNQVNMVILNIFSKKTASFECNFEAHLALTVLMSGSRCHIHQVGMKSSQICFQV